MTIIMVLNNQEKFEIEINELEAEVQKLKKENQELGQSNYFLKKTQKLLLESEERFRNLFTLSPHGIVVVDNDSNIEYYNDIFKNILKNEKGELKGRSFLDFVSEESYETIDKCKFELDSKGVCRDIHLNLRTENHKIPVRLDVANLLDSSGRSFGRMVVIFNEAENRQIDEIQLAYNSLLEEKVEILKNNSRLKNEFISKISNKIKSPLYPIKFKTKFLKEGAIDKLSEEQRLALDEIYNNAEKLENIISDLLDSQRSE